METYFITHYFEEEKLINSLLIAMSVLSIIIGCIFLYLIKYSFYKGIAYPLVLIGILQLVMGVTLYKQASKNQIIVIQCIDKKPSEYLAKEVSRMNKHLEDVMFYKLIEIPLMIFGILLFFYNSRQPFWKGLGLAVFIQCSIVFIHNVIKIEFINEYIKILNGVN